MARTSVLKWVVEVRMPGSAFYETIAAFNHDQVAIDYARRCNDAQRNDSWAYRVVIRRGGEWKTLATFGKDAK